MTEPKKTTHLLPWVDKLVRGETLRPDEDHDRQDLARIVDYIRSRHLIPVLMIELGDGVVGYKMADGDIRDYHDNRDAQRARQEAAIKLAGRIRDAKRAQRLFADLGLQLPAEVVALLKSDIRGGDGVQTRPRKSRAKAHS